MKRAGNLFDRVVEWPNLRWAAARALRSKRQRLDARAFVRHLDSNLAAMREQIIVGTFPLGRFHQFVIHDPKERVITAPCFAERVLHHAIMNVCEPVFERWLIDDTYACRRGRGRIAALIRALRFARRYAFFLKLDVRKYFDSVSHPYLFKRLERLFKDQRLLQLFSKIVASFRGELGQGLPIGSLTSQHLANFYLGCFDRMVKETWRIRGYVRYMDDMLLWSDSKSELIRLVADVREFLDEELGLAIKDHPYVNRCCRGVDFLGCRVAPGGLTLNRRSRVRFHHRLRQLEQQYASGWISEQELQSRATSLVAFTQAAGAACWKFRHAVLQQLPVSGHKARTG